jgi:hypothetical protein
MSNAARIAEATVCDTGGCATGGLLVRGDRVSFLSVERWRQLEREGYKREVEGGDVIWTPDMPESDVPLPAGHVLVHDPSGALLDKCDLYVVRWRGGRSVPAMNETLEVAAGKYLIGPDGRELSKRGGSVEIPDGRWRHAARAKFIRYRRPGFPKLFEHDYDPPVEVRDSASTLAWRLPLPSGCLIDAHGFGWP